MKNFRKVAANAVHRSLTSSNVDGLLLLMSLQRPGYGKAENAIAQAIGSLEGAETFYGKVMGFEDNKPLAVTVKVGESKVYFSCHLDSVHAKDGVQKVMFDSELNVAYKDDETPLGADDAAGIWIMLQLIAAGVPGTYGFHFSEERGGRGSSALARQYPEFLKQFDMAIAFDRRGTTSVITHQGFGKCSSDKFALALAAQINQGGLELAPDNTGVYTDTAEFVDLIPECTNLSVGYEYEHSKNEMLDLGFVVRLRDAVIAHFDPATLPIVRAPGDSGDEFEYGFGFRYGGYDDLPPRDEYDLESMSFKEIIKWVEKADPHDVADLLLHLSDRILQREEAGGYDEDGAPKAWGPPKDYNDYDDERF